MKFKPLLGNEAIAQGAVDSGISGAYSYPGTPATEIQEFIQNLESNAKISCEWSVNEKVAYEKALGMSYAGKRALVSMKHVGLNVASDAFLSSTLTGTNGGLVLAVGDDPYIFSSQSAQDSRNYLYSAKIPCFEPNDPQECYDVTRIAFDISEKYNLPVMIRLTTMLSHSRSQVITGETRVQNNLNIAKKDGEFVLLPNISRDAYHKLITSKASSLTELAQRFSGNELNLVEGSKRGVIASGTAYNYFMEFNKDQEYSYLKISMTYPLPVQKIISLSENVDELIILEEGDNFIENHVRNIILEKDVKIISKFDKGLSKIGELNPEIVKAILGYENKDQITSYKKSHPKLCKGCPHHYTYLALKEVKEMIDIQVVHGDIGCYTLGFYPPYNIIDSTICMGSSISMAMGSADAGVKNIVAVIGDSTFTHSGIEGLLESINKQVPLTLLILDNEKVAMTGGQRTICNSDNLENIVRSLSISKDHLKVISPKTIDHNNNVKTLKKEIEYEGTSVVISKGGCLR